MAGTIPPPNDPSGPSDRELEAGHEPLGAGIDFSDPNSPLAPYYMTAGDVVGVLLICLSVTFFGQLLLWYSDIWGHARFGEWILEHRALPGEEPFTPYSDKSQKPVHTQWLAQSIYGAIIRGADTFADRDPGPERTLARAGEALRLLHTLLAALQLSFMWLAFRRFGGSAGWANVAFLILWLMMMTPLSVQRPQAYGMTAFALLLYALSRPEPARRIVFCLPILFAFWVNLHGSFVVGLGFLLLFTLARAGGLRFGGTAESWGEVMRDRSVRRLSAAFALSVAAAGLCNPHGPVVYYHVATFSSRPNIDTLAEWLPLELSTPAGRHYLVFAAGALTLWGLSGFVGAFWLLACLPFALWPLVQQRGMVWWTLLLPWLISFWGPRAVRRLRLPVLPAGTPSFRKTILAASIVLLAVVWQRPVQALLNSKRMSPPEEVFSEATPWRLGLALRGKAGAGKQWPDMVNALKGYPGGDFRGNIFCSEGLGDYLLWVAPAGSEVLVYSHAHFFPADYWWKCMDTKWAMGDWRGFLSGNRVNMVVIQPDWFPALPGKLRDDPEWEVALDEAEVPGRGQGNRLFIAVRKKPL